MKLVDFDLVPIHLDTVDGKDWPCFDIVITVGKDRKIDPDWRDFVLNTTDFDSEGNLRAKDLTALTKLQILSVITNVLLLSFHKSNLPGDEEGSPPSH